MTTFDDRLYELGGQAVGDPYPGGTVYVNAESTSYSSTATSFGNGSDSNDGKSWASAYLTMSKALANVKSMGRVCFVGDVREELTGSNLLFDVTIQGCGSLHHPDSPADAYHPGGAMWRPPASPTAATPLLALRGRGWKFINIAFDCPVDAAAVQIVRNALSTTSEYDGSHASFIGCRFLSGKYGIDDAGGGNNITIRDCEFAGMTTCAIYGSSTAVANPRAWKVLDNIFPSNVSALGNATHIDASLNEAVVKGNTLGTVTSTAKYIDLTGGNGNIVTQNLLAGDYDTGDYTPGTGDNWNGNYIGDWGVSAYGLSIAVPTSAS